MKLYNNHGSMSDGELLRNGQMLLMLTVILPLSTFFVLTINCQSGVRRWKKVRGMYTCIYMLMLFAIGNKKIKFVKKLQW